MKYFNKSKKNNKPEPTKKRKHILWIVMAIFSAVSIFFTIQNSTSGAKLSYLENEQQRLIEENRKISRELVMVSSLKDLESISEELGFVKPQQIIYLTKLEPVAKVP